MNSEGLGFSVLLYTISSIIAMVVLIVRRNSAYFGKAEIGGPAVGKWSAVALFLTLWVVYIALSWAQIAGIINYSI